MGEGDPRIPRKLNHREFFDSLGLHAKNYSVLHEVRHINHIHGHVNMYTTIKNIIHFIDEM